MLRADPAVHRKLEKGSGVPKTPSDSAPLSTQFHRQPCGHFQLSSITCFLNGLGNNSASRDWVPEFGKFYGNCQSTACADVADDQGTMQYGCISPSRSTGQIEGGSATEAVECRWVCLA